MRISIIGAGSWGTALAIAAARRHEPSLPHAVWPDQLAVTSDHAAALAHAEGGLVIVATPMASLRERLAALSADTCVFWLCKGVESATGALGHQVAASGLPQAAGGVLSGPR